MARTRKPAPPKADAGDTIWIGIRASDENLQRLSALLLFASAPVDVEKAKELSQAPLPFETGEPAPPPRLELDYNLIRRDIVKHMTRLVDAGKREQIVAVLGVFGAEKLTDVKEADLLAVLGELETQ